MSFDGSGFLTLAHDLANRALNAQNQEAELRSIIGRAYYAAFLKARFHLKYVDNDPQIPIGSKVHQYVMDQFEQSPDTTRQEIGQFLTILRLERNQADYDENYPNLAENSQIYLFMADDIIDNLKKI